MTTNDKLACESQKTNNNTEKEHERSLSLLSGSSILRLDNELNSRLVISDLTSDRSDSYESSNEYGRLSSENKNNLNFACANARSVVEKIGSVITAFEESLLHFMLLTETWLSKKHCPPRVLADLTVGANLNFIRKDRGRRGGGVAICYDPTKIRLNIFKAANHEEKGEVVTAVGNSPLTKRKIALMSIYLPPSLKVREVEEILDSIVITIDQIKTKFPDPIIILGGDFNRKSMQTVLTAVPELRAVCAGATRNGYALDEIYCNIDRCIAEKEILRPLCKENGTVSDHSIIAVSAKLPRASRNIVNKFKFRPLTKKGTEKFKALMLDTDWGQIKRATSSESAVALTSLLNTYIESCFPEKERKSRSNDLSLIHI